MILPLLACVMYLYISNSDVPQLATFVLCLLVHHIGVWWRIGRFDAFRPKGCEIESRCSRYVGTLGKSFTRSCLWRLGVKLRHSRPIRAVSGAPLSSGGLKEAL